MQTIGLIHWTRRRLGVVTLTLAVALVVVPVALSYSVNYLSSGSLPKNGGQARTSDLASRQYNEVWRPLYVDVCLAYADANLANTSWLCNAYTNPLTDGRTAVYAYSWCRNFDPYSDSYPTTCQTTHP